MTNEQDEDAMFERLANSLRAVRQDAELVRSSGAEGVSAALARTEAELRSVVTGVEALHQRVAQQQAVTVRLEAAAAKSDAQLQDLRQTVDALSRRVVDQAGLLARLSAPKPRRTGARIGVALVVLVLVLGAGAAAWVASGREPTLGVLVHRAVVRFSALSGIDVAGPDEPAQPVRTVAQAAPEPVSPQPLAGAAPVGAAAARVPADPRAGDAVAVAGTPSIDFAPAVETSRAAPPQPSAAIPSQPTGAAAAAVPPAAQTVATVPAQTVTAAPAAVPPVAPPEPATSAAEAPAQPTAPPHHTLVLRATANAWVQVRQKGGHVLLSRTLKAGDAWPVPAEPDLVLDAGNAEGLDVEVDGVATRLTGAKGGVIHDIPLDADLVRLGAAERGVR